MAQEFPTSDYQVMLNRESSRMDSKTKANCPEFLKQLVFAKECATLKLIELLPLVRVHSSSDKELKIVYLKIFPVIFSHVELSQRFVEQCLSLIAEIKRHPLFIQEKSMFDAWQLRMRSLLPGYDPMTKEAKLIENKFFNIPGTNMYDIIGYAELDLFLRYHKWLKHHKLHKYLYFFANLSFAEIENIATSEDIRKFEEKIDLHAMTTGARNAIVKKLGELKQRPFILETFCKKEYFTCILKIDNCISEIKSILRTPIKKNHVFCQSDLPELVKKAVETVISIVLRLPKEDLLKMYEPSLSLLKMAWGCSFFETDVKNELNTLQSNLNSRRKSCSRRRLVIPKNIRSHFCKIDQRDICAVHFDIENGIRAITWYLENVILFEEI